MRMRYRVAQIPTLSEKIVFFDANPLIYIFWPTSPDSKVAIDYGSVLATLIKHSISVAINETVIAEIINRIQRLEFKKTGLPENQFKNFRDSKEGKELQDEINTILKEKILPKFRIINTPFSKDDIISFLDVSRLDFNDKLIESLCKKEGLVLLTHDKDFSSSDVDILSANPDVLKR